MSGNLGDFDASTVIYGKFTTFRPSTGATFTLAGTPALSVYKDNSTTQSTTGVTLTADFDSVTGLNHFAIDTSADGTFYAAGSFFDIVITTGTVDSVSVTGSVVASFTIRKNSSLKPTTAGRTVVVDAAGLADANVVKIGPSGSGTAQTARDVGASVLLSSGSGTGQLDFTSGVVKANLAQILGTALTETAGLLAGGFKKFFNVASPTLTCLGIDQTGDSYARLGAPAGASVSADVAAVKVDTAAVKVQTDKLTFTVANQIDANVLDWKSATAPAMTGDAFARLGAPAGASVSADVAAVKSDTAAVKTKTDSLTFTVAGQVDSNVLDWKSATAPAMTGDAFARLGAPAGASVSADVAAVKVDTGGAITELSQAVPPTNPTPQQAVMALYMTLRNELTTSATEKTIANNAGTVIFKKSLSDSGTVYTETKAVSGP